MAQGLSSRLTTNFDQIMQKLSERTANFILRTLEREEATGKLTYMHNNPVKGGLVVQPGNLGSD